MKDAGVELCQAKKEITSYLFLSFQWVYLSPPAITEAWVELGKNNFLNCRQMGSN
jgi:hypothetical protein